MQHIQNHIKQIIDGEATPRHDSPELVGVLADIRAILRDRNAQQVRGLVVLQMVNAGIRSGLTTEKTATAGAAGLSADELAYCKAAGKDPVAFAKTKSEEAE